MLNTLQVRALLLTALILAARAVRAEEGTSAGVAPLPGTAVNLSGLLDPPAGKRGFLSVRDGQFLFHDGGRQRFWGAGLSWKDLPDNAGAPQVARRLAAFGINLVGLTLDPSFKPGEMQRLDSFVAELRKNGIYLLLDLTDPSLSSETALYFVDRLGERHRKLATDLLLHRNPLTGLTYVDDPAVAVVQIVSNDSLFRYPDGVSPEHQKQLEAHWNRWLLSRYKDRAGLARAWIAIPEWGAAKAADGLPAGRVAGLLPAEDPAKGAVSLAGCLPAGRVEGLPPTASEAGPSPARTSDAVRFLAELERKYYEAFCKYLRGIGVKCPIVTTDVSCNIAQTWAQTVGDAILVGGDTGLPPDRLMVRTRGGTLSRIAAASVTGKPVLVTHLRLGGSKASPTETPLLFSAYADLQDWDGLIWDDALPPQAAASPPGQFPAAARMYLGRLIAPARLSGELIFSDRDLCYSPRWQWSREDGLAERSPLLWLPFLSRTRNRFYSVAAPRPELSAAPGRTIFLYSGSAVQHLTTSWGTKTISFSGKSGFDFGGLFRGGHRTGEDWMYKEYVKLTRSVTATHWERKMVRSSYFVSDTGQLRWNYGAGSFQFDAPQCQGALGRLAGRTRDLSAVSVKVDSPFAGVSVVSLDGKPLADSKHMLICASGAAEPAKAEITLRHNVFASLLGLRGRVWLLNPGGRRAEEVPTFSVLNLVSFKIGARTDASCYELMLKENAILPF